MSMLYRRLVFLVMVGIIWAIAPWVDQRLGLQWATDGHAVACQALIWLVAGYLVYRMGPPSLRGSSWGALAIGALGAGLNHWWVAHVGGAILVGSPTAQVLHAALLLGTGLISGWMLQAPRHQASRLPVSTPPRQGSAAMAAHRLGERQTVSA